ncbi:hypothetical protein DSO57_1033452 [Entomophthora muscae]|uniref:Uncharacterized protein n=1 Tax=Entomophthora muscae TaxID=34485 RepID=A0ACC2TLV0_9FUNG|nr:hypothetical protein DSO57_1033452 [Entomophthora muscae]
MPDPSIASLTDQVATLQGEIEYLRQRLSNSEDLSSEYEDEGEVVNTPAHGNHGCCPGSEGQSWDNCARALDQLAEVTNDVADWQDKLERKWQPMKKQKNNKYEVGELPPEAGRHKQKNFPNGGEWIDTAKSPAQENNCFLAAFLKEK